MHIFNYGPEHEADVALCNDLANSAIGTGVPDPALVDPAREAADRLYQAVFGEIGPDGKPTASIDSQVLDLMLEQSDTIRESIRQNLIAGRTEVTDYYQVLYQVLADSGALTSNTLSLSPYMADTLWDQLDQAAAAKDHCSLCAACAACSACATCGACGTCLVSVVIGAGVVLSTGAVAGIGGIAGYIF